MIERRALVGAHGPALGVAGGPVAAGGFEPDGMLLVQNQRRNGAVDWTPPGGVGSTRARPSSTG